MTELRRTFDVETVGVDWPGPRLRAHIFTHSQQEWEQAKSAVRHLLDQKLLSPRSYIEGDHHGEDQGISAQNLDAKPHSADLVALFREAAYCVQNELYEKEAYDEQLNHDEEEWQEMEKKFEKDFEVEYDEYDEKWWDEYEDVDSVGEQNEIIPKEEAQEAESWWDDEEKWWDESDKEVKTGEHESVAKPRGRVTAWLSHALTYLSPGR